MGLKLSVSDGNRIASRSQGVPAELEKRGPDDPRAGGRDWKCARRLRPPGRASGTLPAVRWVAASLGGQPCPAARRARRTERGEPRGVRRVPRPAAAHLCSPTLAARSGPGRSAGSDPGARGPSRAPGGIRRQARPLWIPERQRDCGVSNPFPNTKIGRRERERWGRGCVSHRARECACAREGVRV